MGNILQRKVCHFCHSKFDTNILLFYKPSKYLKMGTDSDLLVRFVQAIFRPDAEHLNIKKHLKIKKLVYLTEM